MDEGDKLISDANRLLAQRRWAKAALRTKLMQGQIMKMARVRKRGHLLCTVCDKETTRDTDGNYVHVNKRITNHKAQP